MTKQELMDSIVEKNNGYLTTAEAVANGISKAYLLEYAQKRKLSRIAQGVYMSEDAWQDDLYIICLRNKGTVFSHETALYLHGLMECEPLRISLTVAQKYNATHLRKRGCKVYTVTEDRFELGQTTAETGFGNIVKVYDMDRTVCDIIKNKNRMDIQIFQTAVKEYMKNSRKNLSNLINYARILSIENTVRMYTEVLL